MTLSSAFDEVVCAACIYNSELESCPVTRHSCYFILNQLVNFPLISPVVTQHFATAPNQALIFITSFGALAFTPWNDLLLITTLTLKVTCHSFKVSQV